MRVSPSSPEEISAMLQKSTLPTVVMEGKTDLEVFRKIERRSGLGNIDFLSCGGRNTLLKVYDSRHDFVGKKVAFFADRDTWYFEGIPDQYSEVVFTEGYSIENELYFDGKNRLDEYLIPNEFTTLAKLLHDVGRWFAFELELSRQGGTAIWEKSILNAEVMEMNSMEFTDSFLTGRGFSEPHQSIFQQVKDHHFSGLPGKFIFDCYFKIFRDLREKGDVRFSHDQMHEICFVESIKETQTNSRINQIVSKLLAILQ